MWLYPVDALVKVVEKKKPITKACRKAYLIYVILPYVDENTVPLSNTTKKTVKLPIEYVDYQDMFSNEAASALSQVRADNTHVIDLIRPVPPTGPTYRIAEEEAIILREWINEAIKSS